MSAVHTPEVTPPRLTRLSPSALTPPPPTAGSSGRILTPRLDNGTLPSEQTDGMITDQPVSHYIDPEALKEVSTGLAAQAHLHLSLDVKSDEFWERLHAGYAHEPAFMSPCTKYRFDKHFHVYSLDHKLVVPDHDQLRKQILLWHHEHPWHAHLGIKRTHALITDSFHWPNISQDIQDFVSQCHSCQTMKSP